MSTENFSCAAEFIVNCFTNLHLPCFGFWMSACCTWKVKVDGLHLFNPIFVH